MNDIFTEVGIIIIVAATCALLVRLLKQPPLLGYILAGIALGPLGANVVGNTQILDAMRQIGIALLLFLVGLELDWSKARHQLKIASGVAVLQAVVALACGIAVAVLFGLPFISGLYIGVALAFSSTVIVVKFLSESRDLNSLHGRLAIGILLIQDIIAILALVLLGGVSGASALGTGDQLLILTIKAAALLSLTWLLSEHVLPLLFSRIARSSELLFISSIAWCFFFALVIHQFDFPIESGAFLAGISLASLPYGLDIVNRLRSLRDFFVVLFFVSLGTSLQIPSGSYISLTILLVGFTLVIKPLLTFLGLSAQGFRSRTAFFAGATQSQLSEFSLIVITLGLSRGQISPELASALTFTAICTIFFSTILHTIRNTLYKLFRPILRLAERHQHGTHEKATEEMEERFHEHIVIFGYHRMGYHILRKLHELHHRVVVVDFNPDIIQKLRLQDIDCVYGDVEDEEILETVHVAQASMVVSTIPHRDETTYLIEQVRAIKSPAKLIVTAHTIDDALHYYQIGADYVILPHLLGGEHVADLITRYQEHNLGQYMKHRAEELKLLRTKSHALYFD